MEFAGLPEPLAYAVVVAVGTAGIGLVLIAIRRPTRSLPEILKFLAFLIFTLSGIAATQVWLQRKFDEFGWAVEIQWYGSWLAAIISVGSIAEVIRKRLGIPFPKER